MTCSRLPRSRVMMWRNEAFPRTSSVMPAACGSLEISDRFGRSSARSTSTTRLRFDKARASPIAVRVVPMSCLAPMTAMRLAACAAIAKLLREQRDRLIVRSMALQRWATADGNERRGRRLIGDLRHLARGHRRFPFRLRERAKTETQPAERRLAAGACERRAAGRQRLSGGST